MAIDDALRTTLELTTKKLDDLNKKITTVDGTIRKLSESFGKLPAIKDVEFRVKVTGEAAAKQAINKLASKNTIELNVTTNTEKATRDVGQLRQEIQQLHRAWGEALQAQQKVQEKIEAGALRGSDPLKQTKQTKDQVQNIEVQLKATREELKLAEQLQVQNEKRLATERAIAEGRTRDTALSFTRNQETALANGRAARAQAEEQQREIQRQRQQQVNQFANPPAGSVVRNLAAEYENKLYAAQQRFRNDPFNQPPSAGTVRVGPAELSAKEQATNKHAAFQEFKANLQREAELEEIFEGRVKKTSGAIKQVINALESEVGGAKLARSKADLADDTAAFSKFDEVVRSGEQRIDLLRERLQTVERSEASQLSPQQKVSKINRDLLFLQGEDLENFDLIRAQKAAKAGVNVSALRGKPGTFEPGRLTNPETLIQLGFAGAFGGLPSLLGGVIGGSTPLGPGGALLGSTVAQAAGDILFAKPIELISQQIEKFKEEGLAFERSILGISSILQTQGTLQGPGGETAPIEAQLQARTSQATSIQLAARSQLLPLGIGGSTESTFVQGIVSALSQRGFQATPEQVATIARNIGGAIQAQRPSLLENTQQVLKDIQDIISGGPQAHRTVLSQLIRPSLSGIINAKSSEDVARATAALSDFATAATKLDTPITVLNKLDGAINNLRTTAGTAFLETITPGLKSLFDVLSNKDVVDSVTRLIKVFAQLTELNLKFLAGALEKLANPIASLTEGLLAMAPAVTGLTVAVSGFLAGSAIAGLISVGGKKLGLSAGELPKIARALPAAEQEIASLAPGVIVTSAAQKTATNVAVADAEKVAAGGIKGTLAKSLAGSAAGLGGRFIAAETAENLIPGLGQIAGVITGVIFAFLALKETLDIFDKFEQDKINEQEDARQKSIASQRIFTDAQKPRTLAESALDRAGLKEQIQKEADSISLDTQIREAHVAEEQLTKAIKDNTDTEPATTDDVLKLNAISGAINSLEIEKRRRENASELSDNAAGTLEQLHRENTDILPTQARQLQNSVDNIQRFIDFLGSPEQLQKLQGAADKAVSDSITVLKNAEEKLASERAKDSGSDASIDAALGVRSAKSSLTEAVKARDGISSADKKLQEAKVEAEQKVLDLSKLRAQSAEKEFEQATKVESIFENIAKISKNMEDYLADSQLRRNTRLGQRVSAAEKYIASGGSQADIHDAQVLDIINNPQAKKELQKQTALDELRSTERQADESTNIFAENAQLTADYKAFEEEYKQLHPTVPGLVIPGQLTSTNLQGTVSETPFKATGFLDNTAIGAKGAANSQNQPIVLDPGKSGLPFYKEKLPPGVEPTTTPAEFFPEKVPARTIPSFIEPEDTSENELPRLSYRKPEVPDITIAPLDGGLASVNAQIEAQQRVISDINKKNAPSTFDLFGLKIPTPESLLGLDKPRNSDADNDELLDAGTQLGQLYKERDSLVKKQGSSIAGPELGPDGLPKRHILPGLDPEYDKKYATLKRNGFKENVLLKGLVPYDQDQTSDEKRADSATAAYDPNKEYQSLQARYTKLSESLTKEGETPKISALINDYSKDLETYKSHLGPQTSGSVGAGVLGASAGTSTDPTAPAVDTQTQILQMLTRIAASVEKRGGITADEMRVVMESSFT